MYSVAKKQMLEMLELQNKLNEKVNPNWITAGNNWRLAIVIEAVEAIEHYGWKWWKKQNPNIPQLKIELVDIWHFILSDLIVNADNENMSLTTLADIIVDKYFNYRFPDYNNVIQDLQLLIHNALEDSDSIVEFSITMTDVNMSWEELYKFYISKNCLNIFRQNNGYKDGTYIKNWGHNKLNTLSTYALSDVVEDNVHLDDIVNNNDIENDFYNVVMNELQRRYDSLSIK